MATSPKQLTLRDFYEASRRIRAVINQTPLVYSPVLSEIAGSTVYLKMENIQPTGAFKIRGAANKIMGLSDAEKKRGITTYSTGNHGIAVAYVANKLGIPATVCISHRVPEAKVGILNRMGAHIIKVGNSQDEAARKCRLLYEREGQTIIEPFDDLDIIAGQGTIGLELLQDCPKLDRVIIPLSGGGLLSGIGCAIKTIDSSVNITGVCMNEAAVMVESLKKGAPIEMEEADTFADSLLGGIGTSNSHTYSMVGHYMDEFFQLSEPSIARGIAFMLEHQKMAIEGAAATGIAALLDGVLPKNEKVAVIISGNNIDLSILLKAVNLAQKTEF